MDSQGFVVSFFRKEKKDETWFEELDQIINKAVADCSVLDLDHEFRRQPGLIAYWSFVLSELLFIKEQFSRDLLELESKLVKDVLKGSNVNLTYRILDLICVSNPIHKGLRLGVARIDRAIKKVEGILASLDHKRSTLNYMAKQSGINARDSI